MRNLVFALSGILVLSNCFASDAYSEYIKKSLAEIFRSTSSYEGKNIETKATMTSNKSWEDNGYHSSFYLNYEKKERTFVLNCVVDCNDVISGKVQGKDAFAEYAGLIKKAKHESRKVKVRGKYESGKLLLDWIKVYRKEFEFR